MAFGRLAEALMALNNPDNIPDVVFCDIEMTGINGLEFAVRLKKISPQTKIIFVTAYSEYALEAFRIHANGYILKPMNVVRVLDEINGIGESSEPEKKELLIRQRGQIAIHKENVDCDYYRMLAGDMDAVNAFKGEYMSQYSWAEITAGQLTFGKW